MTTKLTKVQQATLTKLKSKNYDDLTLTNITRLMKKLLSSNSDELRAVLPTMIRFYESKMDGKSKIEIANDVIRRIKGKDDKAKLRALLGGDKGRPPLPKDNYVSPIDSTISTTKKKRFDNGKTLNETLDALNNDKENEIIDTNATSKRRAIEPSGATPEYAKGFNLPDKRPVIGGDKGRPPTTKLKAMAVKGSRGDAGQYANVEYDQLLPGKKNVWEGDQMGGKEVYVGEETKTKPYEPYSGQAFQLSESDIKNKKPATIEEFMKRNNRKGTPKEEDYKAYSTYMENAQEGIDGLKNEWQKIQDDIARNRQKAQETGDAGRPLTDKDDPFGILRSLGYTNTTDMDDKSVSILSGSFFRAGGDLISMIPYFGKSELGKVIRGGFNVLGDITEGMADWAQYQGRKRDYEWGKLTLDEIRAYGSFEEREKKFYSDPKNKGVGFVGLGGGERGDEYYQPKWNINTFLPTPLDPYGEPNLNGGLQAQFLQPLQRYTGLLNSTDIDFVDSVTPEQKKFLQQLRSTLVQIKQGTLNITHKQYRDLLRATINEFTPTQRSSYLKSLEKDVMDDVSKVYRSGADGNKGTVQGGAIPFGERFIQDVGEVINKSTSTGGGGADPDPSRTDTDQVDPNPDPQKTKTKEDEEDPDPTKTKTDEEDPDPDPDSDPEPDDEDEGDEGDELPDAPPDTAQFTTFDAGEPKFRPRMKWGGTDEMFEITESDKQKRNLIIETATLNDGINRTSELYKRQQRQYDNRYGKTFPMPRPYNYLPPSNISREWQNKSRPVMIEGYAPVGRRFYDTAYDPYTYGQYQMFAPKYDYTVFKREQMNNQSVYPDVANEMTDGGYDLKPQNITIDAMTMMMNQRWVS